MAVTTDLSGRTTVITGAGRGIGKSIAHRFADAGSDVVLAARSEDEIESVARDVEREYGVSSLAVPTDVRAVEDLDALMEETVAAFGPPGILVNNAGVNYANRAVDQTVEEVDAMIDVNFRAPFLLSQRFAWAFDSGAGASGSIVNVSSVAGHVGKDFTSLYGGTKAGLYGLTRGLAAGLAAFGIRVNSVSPATTRVERVEERIEEWGEDMYETDKIPLERLCLPEDVADAVLFLASDRADFVTGIDVPVDGGVGFTAGMYPHN